MEAGSFQPERRNLMNDENTTMKTVEHDWSRLETRSDAEARVAALAGPDA